MEPFLGGRGGCLARGAVSTPPPPRKLKARPPLELRWKGGGGLRCDGQPRGQNFRT